MGSPRSTRRPERRRGRSASPTVAEVAARLQSLVERCRAAGMNVTPQRLAIYRALLEAPDHPSPEMLYERVRPSMPALSLATIYKTLEALAGLGLVDEMPATGNSRRYDANVDRHHHLVCMRCNRVEDYVDAALDRLAPRVRVPGFTAHHLSIHVHGLCEACAGASAGAPPSTRSNRRDT